MLPSKPTFKTQIHQLLILNYPTQQTRPFNYKKERKRDRKKDKFSKKIKRIGAGKPGLLR